jgi:hypothetical protein
MLGVGPFAEVSLGVAISVGPRLDVMAGVGARAGFVSLENGAGYFADTVALHGLIPARRSLLAALTARRSEARYW